MSCSECENRKIVEIRTQIINEVCALMGWKREKAMSWYHTKNPNFGGASPFKLVVMDRGHKVLQFIKAALEDGPLCGQVAGWKRETEGAKND